MKQVFFDIDTQIDFLLPAGSLYVPGAEKLISTLAVLNRQAPVLISTMCEHSENDEEFTAFPPHCVTGTVGQNKPASLLVPNQILFAKKQLNAFADPRLDSILRSIGADEYIVYGVVTEICVQFVAEKLLTFGKPVMLVSDAVQHLDLPKSTAFLEKFRADGGFIRASSGLQQNFKHRLAGGPLECLGRFPQR
jgi:nicotinamidase/pyrazinamidase